MAGRAVSDKLWQIDIITKNKISGDLGGNDQMIPNTITVIIVNFRKEQREQMVIYIWVNQKIKKPN